MSNGPTAARSGGRGFEVSVHEELARGSMSNPTGRAVGHVDEGHVDDPIETVWDDRDPVGEVSLPDASSQMAAITDEGHLDDSFHRVGAAFQSRHHAVSRQALFFEIIFNCFII